jgi:hypothetical protein
MARKKSMTAETWAASSDFWAMLEHARPSASFRKLRLFACACCRHFFGGRMSEKVRRAVEAAELYADDRIGKAELVAARAGVKRRFGSQHPIIAAWWATHGRPREAAFALPWETFNARRDPAVGKALCDLLREVLGNLPRPVTLAPAWLTPDVRALAHGIYEGRAFERLPILGDALEDAGCTDEEILAHLHSGGEHFRACWALDAVLGKG